MPQMKEQSATRLSRPVALWPILALLLCGNGLAAETDDSASSSRATASEPRRSADPSSATDGAAQDSLLDKTNRLIEQSRDQGSELWRRSIEEIDTLWQRSAEAWRNTGEALKPPPQDDFNILWSEVVPTLEDTLVLQDAQRDLPEQAWFARDQQDAQEDIDRLLDQAVAVLSMSPLQNERDRIAGLHETIESSRAAIARYRQERVGAPTQSLVARTRDDYDELIAAEEDKIDASERALSQIKREFAAQLRVIGLELSDEQVEFLLATVVGDSMIDLGIVFDNVRAITVELADLVQDSGEDLQSARRYYGLYVVLLRALKQMHLEVEQTIETVYIPQIDSIRDEARRLNGETRKLIRQQPDRRAILEANLEAQQLTIEAAERYRDYLAEQARQVREARKALQVDIQTAWNTYETVRVSGELVALVQSSQALLDGLLQRQVPPLRPFENLQMKREFEKLTDRLRAAEE